VFYSVPKAAFTLVEHDDDPRKTHLKGTYCDICASPAEKAAATLDDQFDSAALLSLGFDKFAHVEEEDLMSDEELDFERGFWNSRKTHAADGRSAVTGY
jgi:hypothetical protein